MKILVTGATGYFGGALLPRLAGHELTAIGHEHVDLCDPSAAKKKLGDWRWDAVVHLAGPAPKVDQTWTDSANTITTHVRALLHVVNAIPAGWPGRFVHISGAIAYGAPEKLPVTEDHPRHPVHAYGLAKQLTEDVLLGSNLQDRWILRMGGLFSQNRKSGALFNFARAAMAGETLNVTTSEPPVPWEFIHLDDAVESIVRSLSAEARDPGPINIGYGEPINVVEIAERFAARGGRGATVSHSGPQPPTFHADISKARALLAWPPVSLTARIEELFA